ncbi:MAG: PLP-dependent transferase [Flavobacteriaceae bacterium]|nr:PLP-dependent transferase [Flavobacteriaceae bacterium]
MLNYLKNVLENMPSGWLSTTTHRLDIYDEKLAKTEFLEQFKLLCNKNIADTSALDNLPTAYDYIRLGHPLSCILEWAIAYLHDTKTENIISFSSQTIPVLAILRKNLLVHKNTQIVYSGNLPVMFDAEVIKQTYGYQFELKHVEKSSDILDFEGSTIFVSQDETISVNTINSNIDFFVNIYEQLGSVLVVNGVQNEHYISEIQHVRRRETIAMTPVNCYTALQALLKKSRFPISLSNLEINKKKVLDNITSITGSHTKPLVGSSGLSIQYAIMMGLINYAQENHKEKSIKFIVPPNCYGGTNDQARRVAACNKNVEVVDLLVDGEHDMVQSIDTILAEIASQDAVPYIIAEIPTNPRVEVPDLQQLKTVLEKKRTTKEGMNAIDAVFILDQTFCPNVLFLGKGEVLSTVRTISYASGSKFPSGGQCTAGYCVGNIKTVALMSKIEKHLILCDNQATELQYKLLAKQLPSMNQRISDAYNHTRDFVNFITKTLPSVKINFVSQELALLGFTPSVFSLDLPTKGTTVEEKETYKRALNLTLINLMITKIPNESKFCVSYGQLKGSYWTIPATSTQGTTKEGDKDYIVRVALSPTMNIALHKKVFLEFATNI